VVVRSSLLSELIKKVVEIPEILAKIPVEDTKIHPKRPYRPFTSPGRKKRKKTRNIAVFSQGKTFF
jgi:hypothetical protein